ncbi:MAG: hypothetical protein HS116_21555 [Planctomycetes bacterium]|nr:hypothetical protein [Planctomycetota bacterium]
MEGAIVSGLVLAVLAYGFAVTFYRELKRTPWDMLEALTMFAAVGHAVALPIAWAEESRDAYLDNDYLTLHVAMVGAVVGMFMAGGAVWVVRRLNRLNERHRKTRLLYLLGGLMLFPSMVAAAPLITVPFLCPLWIVLYRLHRRTEHLPDPWALVQESEFRRRVEERRAAREARLHAAQATHALAAPFAGKPADRSPSEP